MRIFLSYGREDCVPLAERLRGDLKSRGYEVWFDADRIKAGVDWEQYIENALNLFSADLNTGRFVFLMTPHSVRRDGYCLNELVRALQRKLRIIPVMVSEVEVPLSINTKHWLDMLDCVPVQDHEKRYFTQLEKLVDAIEHPELYVEGVQARLSHHLRPLSYRDEVLRLLTGFTGREWVMAKVEGWLQDSQQRVLWITGEMGVGKSAIAAWLCDHRPEMIAAFHFCQYDDKDSVDAKRALFSIAYQLSTRLPDYRDYLNKKLDNLSPKTNAQTVFKRLFVEPLYSQTTREPPIVILIDALDEATEKGRNELAEIIGTEFAKKEPSWLRLIVTSRPNEVKVNEWLEGIGPGRWNSTPGGRKTKKTFVITSVGSCSPSPETVSSPQILWKRS